jgi:hypothetical protein
MTRANQLKIAGLVFALVAAILSASWNAGRVASSVGHNSDAITENTQVIRELKTQVQQWQMGTSVEIAILRADLAKAVTRVAVLEALR